MPASSARPALAERSERAVSAVDMQPEAAFATERRDRTQRIDRAGVRGPGCGYDQQRLTAGAGIRLDRRTECVDPHALVAIALEHADLVRTKAQESRGAGDR
jgi:hypothetical protein